MGSETNTAKVQARKSETPTEKIPGGLMALISKAKSNPWVLVVLALGGGKGTEEVLAQLGQNIQWWWIALGIGGFSIVDAAGRLLRDVSEIKAALKVGAEKFTHIEAEVKSLHDWRKEVVSQQVAAAQSGRRKKGSEGSLRTA